MIRFIYFLISSISLIFPLAGYSGILNSSLPGSTVPETIELHSSSSFPDWLSIWKKARSTARKGNLAEAVQEYQRLISLKSNINEAHWELARIRVVQGEYELAADRLERLLPEYRQRPDVLTVMAQVQERLGHRERAIRFYRSILNSEEDGNLPVLSGLVRCLLAEDENENALPYLEKLYELTGQDKEVAEMLARLYFDLEYYRKSLAVLEPLVENNSGPANILLLAAKSEDFLGNRQRSYTYWKKLLKLEEDNQEAHSWLAGYYEEEKDWQAALTHLRPLQDLRPEDKDLFLRIARCYTRLNELENGLEFVNQYLEKYPHDRDALRFLVNINASLGREDKTLAALDRYFAVEPKPPAEKLKQAARLYDAQGRYREAIPIYKKLIRNNPDDSSLLKTLAEDLLAIGEDEGALHILNQLAVISPKRETYRAMADLLEKLERRDELVLVLERLHIKDPANPETVLRLISLYLEEDEIKRAHSLYREIADRHLASPRLLRQRGSFAVILGMQEHGLRDYAKFLETKYEREICLTSIRIAGRLGLVSELQSLTALYLRKSGGWNTGGRQTVKGDLLKNQVFHEIGAADYLCLAKAWRDAFLHDTSQAMYQFIIDKPGASRSIRLRAYCGLGELYYQEGLIYEAEEAYRMAMAVADNNYHIIGRLVEICLALDDYEKAAAWLSLMDYADKEKYPVELASQLSGCNPSFLAWRQSDFSAGGQVSQSATETGTGDLYDLFLAVKSRISRGAFRDAVSSGEVLVEKILEERDSDSSYNNSDHGNRDLRLLESLKSIIAVAHIYLHDYEQAEQLISELDNPGYPSPLSDLLRLIMIREKGGDQNEAFSILITEARYDLGLLEKLHAILTTLEESGFNRLREDFTEPVRQAVLDKNQESLKAAVLLCRSLATEEVPERALALCRKFLHRFPGNVTLQSLVASLYYRLHRDDSALFYCNKVLDQDKRRADMLLLKARIIWYTDREKSLSIIESYLKESTGDLIKTAAARESVSLPPRPEMPFWRKYKEKIIKQEESGESYLDTIMEPDFLMGSAGEDIFTVIYQYYARYRWEKLFREEAAARQAVIRDRYFRAAHHFSNLLTYREYSDISLLFDLARVYGKMGRFEDEASLYSQIKKYDADFPGLDEQIKRNRLQLRPRTALNYRYLQEEGWDGYKAMERSEGGVGSHFIFSPQEQLQLNASHIRYDPTVSIGDPLSSKRLFMSSKGRFFNRSTFKFGAGVEFLNYDNSRTGLFLCQINREFADDLSAELSFERDIVADTYASLTRNVVANNSHASIAWDISSFFSAGGDYGLTSYSDSNKLDEYSLWTKCHIFGKPSYLTFTYEYSFKDAEESQVDSGPVLPDGFHAEDHPYWAPQNYWENSFSLDWQQQISALFMEHKYPGYYSASYSFDYDERGQVRQSVEGGIYLEWGQHFIGKSFLKYTTSENYDVREFSLAAVYRW